MAGLGKMKNRNDTSLRRYAVTPSRCVHHCNMRNMKGKNAFRRPRF